MLRIQYLQLENNDHPEYYLRCTHLTGMRTKKGSTELWQWRASSPIEPVRDWSTRPAEDRVLFLKCLSSSQLALRIQRRE